MCSHKSMAKRDVHLKSKFLHKSVTTKGMFIPHKQVTTKGMFISQSREMGVSDISQ